MRALLQLRPLTGALRLPIHHQHLLQAAAYHLFSPAVARYLHDRGFAVNQKTFRLFTFSRLEGPYRLEAQSVSFRGALRWTISSPLDLVVSDVANVLLREAEVRLGSNRLMVESITVQRPVVEAEHLVVRTLSPITVHQTVWRPDGRPYQLHLHPKDRHFQTLVAENLWQKYQAVHGWAIPTEKPLTIEPVGTAREHILLYKGGVIKGYTGRFYLTGPLPLLQLAIDAGVGSRNAQGFGLVEMVGEGA
ncbi:MAG: CRISPR-associated endoribonuclease Cas6 [Firmicutes bacterium]|nr:CRISPR-associated endoribonuclease Cas6 [Alicyclobacillaceae bacterium]MCL6498043.1 CRISPR-associated endoribonuclease Cas6 [Bacillota bacterium]